MLERVNHEDAVDPDRANRQSKMAVNLRVGEHLVLQAADAQIIHVVLEAKHGQGARLVVKAHRSVKIVPPDT